MQQPALWNDRDWEGLQPLRNSPGGETHLQHVVDLVPPPSATVDDIISATLLAPSNWQPHCFDTSGGSATTLPTATTGSDTGSMITAIEYLHHVARCEVDFLFVDRVSQALTVKLEGQTNERLRERFGSAESLRQAWEHVFCCEQSVTGFLIAQLSASFFPALAPLLFDPERGRFIITGEVMCGA